MSIGTASQHDPRKVLASAREALEQQRWDESSNAFEQLLDAPAYGAEARYGLGWIALQQGDPERAAGLFRDAVERDSAHANAWFALGRLTEDASVDEAIDCYRHAVAANPQHYGALERLRLFDPPTTTPAADSGPTHLFGASSASRSDIASVADPPPQAAIPGEVGIVEFLRRDNTDIAREALERIASLERVSHFRAMAHLQSLARRLTLIVLPASILAYVLYHITPLTVGGKEIHFYGKNVTELILGAVLVWGISATWTVLECVTNTVTIRNARIRWTHGVLSKHTETLDLWTARDVDLHRNVLQRLTGDGTLCFRGTTHDRPRRFGKGQPRPLRLAGVAGGPELDAIYALLLDLKFLLRAHPGMKGIIQ